MHKNFISTLLLLTTGLCASCSQSQPIGITPSSSNDLLSSIHAALDDGDERIQRIQQASKRREYSAMFHDYDTLRASYIDVVSQITTNQLTDESLAPFCRGCANGNSSLMDSAL